MVVELDIICPRGQVRGETNISPLGQLEESNGGLWCRVEEWVAECRRAGRTVAVYM